MENLHQLKMLYYKLESVFYMAADKYFFQIAAMMISVSFFIIAVALTFPLLQKWFGAKWRKALWIFVAVRLLVPFHYSIPDPPVKLFQIRIYSYVKIVMALTAVWGIGTVIYLCMQFLSYFLFRRKCIRSMKQIEKTEMQQMFQEVLQSLPAKRQISMYQCDFLRAPMVLGFKKQLLLIPDEQYTCEDFKYILSHECIHIIKKDIWLKLLLTMVTGLYWFNPFIHWMKNLAFHDIEIVCDSQVIKGKNEEEKARYSKAILKVLNRERTKNIAYSTDFYSGKNAVKERITNIMSPEKKTGIRQWVCLAAVLLFYAGTSMLISCGYSYQQEQTDKQEADIYSGYEEPPAFNKKALAELEKLIPADANPYIPWEDNYADKVSAGIEEKLIDPYQAMVYDPDFYQNVAVDLIYTYLDKYLDEDSMAVSMEDNLHPFSYIDNVTTLEKVAGDREEFAAYVNFRIYYPYLFDDIDIKERNWGIVSKEYIDCSWVVIGKRRNDYVYELKAITGGEEGISLLAEKIKKEKPENEAEMLESLDMLPRLDVTIQGDMETADLSAVYPEDKGEKLCISMLDEKVGYLAAAGERVMSTEMVLLYKTTDGGVTWKDCGPIDDEGNPLMTGMSFATEDIGFVTCKSGQFPYVYRTVDGGKHWEIMDFNPAYEAYKWYREGYADAQYKAEEDRGPKNRYEELRSFYTLAYAPEFNGEKGTMYVGMEEYGEFGSNQLKLVTQDYGMTWYIEGIVYRQEYKR